MEDEDPWIQWFFSVNISIQYDGLSHVMEGRFRGLIIFNIFFNMENSTDHIRKTNDNVLFDGCRSVSE